MLCFYGWLEFHILLISYYGGKCDYIKNLGIQIMRKIVMIICLVIFIKCNFLQQQELESCHAVQTDNTVH